MLYERRHWAVKFIWIEYSEKLDVTIYFLVLVTLITLTWIIAYIWFSITYVRLRPKLTWNFYCFVNKYVCDVIHCQNWLLATAFALYLSIFMKFMKPRRTDIKILFASQQNLRTYTGSLIYGVRLQVNVGDRLAKKISQCVAALFWKKKLKKMSFVSNGHCRDGSLNFNFFYSVSEIKLWLHIFLPKQAQIWW